LDDSKGFSDVERAKQLEKEAILAKINFKLKIWPGVGHAFMN